MFALISSEELEGLGQIMVKQLKNRYTDPSQFKRFVVGIDKPKMRLYDIDDSGQNGIIDSGMTFKSESPKKKFEGFKV